MKLKPKSRQANEQSHFRNMFKYKCKCAIFDGPRKHCTIAIGMSATDLKSSVLSRLNKTRLHKKNNYLLNETGTQWCAITRYAPSREVPWLCLTRLVQFFAHP